MPPEPPSNWGFVPRSRESRPDPRFLQYSPAWFLGRTVKIALPCLDCPHAREHVWVCVFGVLANGLLLGRLANDPQHRLGAQSGEPVLLSRAVIEAVWDG